MTAGALLETLQRDHLRSTETAPLYEARARALYIESMAHDDPATRALLEDNLRKQDAYLARYAPHSPTAYQSLQDLARLMRAKERIDATLARVGEYQPCSNLVVGSDENEHLNAMSTYCADSAEYLVVFNRGLLAALLHASNYVIAALMPNPEVGNDDPFKSSRPLEEVERGMVEHTAPRYRELLQAVSEYRLPDPRLTIPMFSHVRWEARWTMIEDFVTDFVFAHEYAHILRGHVSGSARTQLSDDQGGWGREYEADSLALDFVAQTWMRELEGNPVGLAFLLQGVCLFFAFMCQIERYSAEVLAQSSLVWRSDRTHPPTFVRWLRMLAKARDRSHVPWSFILPQLGTIHRCLTLYYAAAVGRVDSRSEAFVEWRLQRIACEQLGRFELVPQHLFIAACCVREAVNASTVPDGSAIVAAATEADRVLEASGARPLRDYRMPLELVVRMLSEQALADRRLVGAEAVRGSIDRLAAIYLHDAQTRYPAQAVAT